MESLCSSPDYAANFKLLNGTQSIDSEARVNGTVGEMSSDADRGDGYELPIDGECATWSHQYTLGKCTVCSTSHQVTRYWKGTGSVRVSCKFLITVPKPYHTNPMCGDIRIFELQPVPPQS